MEESKLRPLPVEGRDYYVERGAWVFTREYHLKRGHCCGNGCRHCPYRGVVESDEAKEVTTCSH